ncbi:MAG: DUF4954 family protein, partial [Planctomycetes bacterium]|nr:DUF4954 family protein [Planctomycetota bacterium]
DGDKWPARDRRSDPEKLDLINFAVFSPLTIGRMMKGLKEITALYEAAPREQDYVNYNGISIKRLMCRTAKKHYEIGIKIYLGSLLASRLEANANPAEALAAVKAVPQDDEWVDLLGLLAPRPEVESLCDSVESGKIKTLADLEAALRKLHNAYGEYEWRWAQAAWKDWTGKSPAEMTPEELAKAIADWRDAAVKLNNMILGDAEKEFVGQTRLGFGIDGDDAVRDLDFTAVRGTFEGNKFVKQLNQESIEVKQRAEAILKSLGK